MSQQVKDEVALVQQISQALTNGTDIPEDAFGMNEDLYLRCQLSLVRAAVAQDNTRASCIFLLRHGQSLCFMAVLYVA